MHLATLKSLPYTPIVLNHIGGPIGIGPYVSIHHHILQGVSSPRVSRCAVLRLAPVRTNGFCRSTRGACTPRVRDACWQYQESCFRGTSAKKGFETYYLPFFSRSACRTFSAVMGSDVMRTPTAS